MGSTRALRPPHPRHRPSGYPPEAWPSTRGTPLSESQTIGFIALCREELLSRRAYQAWPVALVEGSWPSPWLWSQPPPHQQAGTRLGSGWSHLLQEFRRSGQWPLKNGRILERLAMTVLPMNEHRT